MKTKKIFKKLNILFIFIMLSMMLTGCKNSFDHMPDLTEDERKIIAQYIADIMVKHDKNNGKLVTDYEIQQYDEKEAQKQANLDALLAMKHVEEISETEGSDSTNSNSSDDSAAEYVKVYTPLHTALGVDGFTIYYNTFYITDSYSDGTSEDSFFALDASPGNKLLVAEFIAQNEFSDDQVLDIFDINVKFKLGINEEYPRLTMSTMLLDDMSIYKNTIQGGSSQKMVLLREISDSDAAIVQNISVEAVVNGITYYIQ